MTRRGQRRSSRSAAPLASCRPRRRCAAAPTPPPERVTLPPGAPFGAVTDSLAAHGVVAQPARRSSCSPGCGAWTARCRPACTSSRRDAALEGARHPRKRRGRPPRAVHGARGAHHPGDRGARRASSSASRADSVLAAARDGAAASALLGYPVHVVRGVPPAGDLLAAARHQRARELVRVMAEGFKADWKPEWDAAARLAGHDPARSW